MYVYGCNNKSSNYVWQKRCYHHGTGTGESETPVFPLHASFYSSHKLVSHSSSLQTSHARASLGLVEVRSGVHPELQRNMVPH